MEQAAKRYDVPITTLKDRVRGRVDVETVKSGTPPLFTQEQESTLATYLRTMGEIGYGYSRQETINLASDYAFHFGIRDKNHPLSQRWFYGFLNRWPDLKLVKPRSLEIARAKSATPTAINNYFNELNRIMTKYNLKEKPHLIYNVDEKGLSPDHKPPKIVTGKMYKAQAVTSGKGKTVTVIGCANATGQQVPPFFVFPGQRMLDSLMQGASAGADGDVSESGWSNSDLFSRYVKEHLNKFLPSRDNDTYVLVLYDGHTSHVTLPLIEWAIQNNIILFVLPPHCSHLLQPLDVGCYGPFEHAWNAACHSYMRESGGCVISRYDICEIACKVYTSTLTSANIQAAFKKSGVFPFNANVISADAVAPSASFQATSDQNPQCSENTHEKAVEFLEKRGGEVLKNVKITKTRNTLSKIVGGKAITEPDIVEKIKSHVDNQKRKPLQKQLTKKKATESKAGVEPAIPSTSGTAIITKKRKLNPVPPEDSQSSESETDESEACIVCKKFTPTDMHLKPFLYILKWGKCDKCLGWVHLTFCTPIKVLRRGDTFLCPSCKGN